MPALTSLCCCAVATGPIRTSSRDGSPTAIAAIRSFNASHTSANRDSGTNTRQIAVHFWPVFCVMSRATSCRNSAPVSLPRSTSGASTAALSESASMLRRTGSGSLFRSIFAVSLPPVHDERGGGRRLRDHGHPGEQRARQLLAQPPCREVERVDVHGDAAAPRPHVLVAQARGAADLDGIAGAEQRCATERLAELRVMRERDGAAVDVELRIAARVAAVRDRECNQFLARAVDRLRERREHRTALRERHAGELACTCAARVRERRREVVTTGVDLGEHLLGGRIDERLLGAGARRTLAGEIAGEELHGGVLTMLLSWAGSSMLSPMFKRLFYGLVAILIVIIGGGVGYYFIGEGKWPLSDCQI